MVQMAFFLRFRSQLQRIRPELIPHLENAAARAINDAGGNISGDRGLIRAVFDENSLGFWLDILLLIETLTQTLEEAAPELHGFSLLLGKVLPDPVNALCRSLSGGTGGVFLDKTVTEAMSPYITVEENGKWTAVTNKYGLGPFSRLNEIKIFIPTAKVEFPLNKPNNGLSEPGQRPVVLIASQSFEGKRDKLYLRVADYAGSGENADFTPLFVRFSGGGLNSLIDSWAEWMQRGTAHRRGDDTAPPDHPRAAGSSSSKEELYTAWEFLFRQRLRNKPSPFAIRTARRFFALLLGSYRGLAQAKRKTPVIILENIQNAEQTVADIVIEALRGWHDFVLLGTCTGEISDAGMAKWKLLFPQLTRINSDDASGQELPNIPLDLWEIGYACSLLGRYFPPDLLPRLLEEAGKSSMVVSRALSLLYALRVIDTPLDARPWHRHFQHRAEIALGRRKDRIRTLVRSRLLAWVTQKKIDPCLRLLEILKELNDTEEIEDSLILQSIHCELSGVEGTELESIRYSWVPEAITGPIRAPILRHTMETLIALHSGNAKNIQTAFACPPPDCSAFPLLRAQALLNQSLYYMGLRDIDSTAEAVKESSLLFQESGGGLAQAYRLFALASLFRRRIGETIDYLGFALENAATSGSFQDIGMAAYYAASVQMLYGNLSRSKTLAEKACRHFLRAGSPEWADRSGFLLGRLAFEIGSYRQAIDIFENIRQNSQSGFSSEKNALLEAWAYRAQVCREPFHVPRPVCEGRDADLFEIEALCFAGNYSKVMELSGTLSGSPGGNEFLCIERPDWRSGFAQCELLYFSWDDLRDRMLCAYHSMAEAGLSSANGEEAMRAMQRVLRGGQFLENDPYDVFFHYAWYNVLKQAGSSQVDIRTAVSVAFKRLQSRAGRIDDTETRRQYLTQPRWNKAIEQAARDFKLV